MMIRKRTGQLSPAKGSKYAFSIPNGLLYSIGTVGLKYLNTLWVKNPILPFKMVQDPSQDVMLDLLICVFLNDSDKNYGAYCHRKAKIGVFCTQLQVTLN